MRQLPICLILLSLLSACAPQAAPDTRTSDEAAIRAADAEWSKKALAHDLEAVLSYYTADASLLAPNAPIAVGSQAIRAAWTALLGPDVTLSWEASKVEVAKSGDLGYLVGTYSLAMKDAKGKPIADRGKMTEVWKKQADGSWKVVADTFNSDLPLP